MSDSDQTDELQSLFTSITGDTSVEETQQEETVSHEVAEAQFDEDSDTIEHHGFDDVIDQPDLTEDPVQ